MATQKVLDRYGNEVDINLADNINIAGNGTGFDLEQADGTLQTVRFNEIDGTTNNPKMQVLVNGVVVQTIQLNKNDINISTSNSDFDLTDDILNFQDEDGNDNNIDFSKYNISVATVGGDIQISQDGSVVTTISQNADGITFDNAGSDLTSTDVEAAIKEVNAKIADGATPRQDDFVATAGQTAFTFTETPVGQVKMVRNGITLRKVAFSVA